MRTITTPAEFLDLQRECIRQVTYYVEIARKKLGITFPTPRVLFGLQGTTAGRAYFPDNKINFQPTLLRENADHFVQQTVGHEVGHLAAYFKYGMTIKPHGHEWASVMWHLGLPATRCHNYDVSNVATRVGKIHNPNKGIRGIGQITDFNS